MVTPSSVKEVERPGGTASVVRLMPVCLALALPGLFAARHLASWPGRLVYPGELDGVEGRAMAEMVHLREGVPIYAPASWKRFDAGIYGPLFYLLGSRLIDPKKPNYCFLRTLSMLATLGLAAGCATLAFWLTRSYVATGMSPLIFLGYSFGHRFGTVARSDSVALLLSFWGFLLAYRLQNSRKVLVAVPLMSLAFWYKAQFVVGPLAVLLFLLLERRFRLAVQFAALLGLTGLGLLAVLHFLIFPHQSLLLHLLRYNVIPFSWRAGARWLSVLGLIFLLPSLMAVRFLRAHPGKLLTCYLGWAVFLLPLTLAKKGTSLNYCFELTLVLCPLVAAIVTTEIGRRSRRVLVLLLLAMTVLLSQLPRVDSDPRPEDFAEDEALQLYLRGNFPPGTPSVGYFTGDLVRAGLATPITDLFQYSWLVCQGTLSEQDLLAQLQGKRFGVILLTNDLLSEREAHDPFNVCLTEALHQAILQNYRLARRFTFHIQEKRHYYAWVRAANGTGTSSSGVRIGPLWSEAGKNRANPRRLCRRSCGKAPKV